MEAKDILYLNKILANYLWKMASEDNSLKLSNFSPKLIAPLKRKKQDEKNRKQGKKQKEENIRISEQEARFLMCLILNNLNIFYSIETPTREIYAFKGETPRSAATDLTLFEFRENENKFVRIFNIEFKAHNPKEENFSKDIEKLVREKIHGGWFHLLKNVDRKTLPSLFEKMKKSFNDKIIKIFNEGEQEIIFSFCVLEKRWLCQKVLKPGMDIEKFFHLDYSVKGNKIIINDSNDWEIFA